MPYIIPIAQSFTQLTPREIIKEMHIGSQYFPNHLLNTDEIRRQVRQNHSASYKPQVWNGPGNRDRQSNMPAGLLGQVTISTTAEN